MGVRSNENMVVWEIGSLVAPGPVCFRSNSGLELKSNAKYRIRAKMKSIHSANQVPLIPIADW